MSRIITILVLVLFLILGLFYILNHNSFSKTEPILQSPLSFEECSHFPGVKLTPTYPNQCATPNGVMFLEPITEPIDSQSWEMFDTKLGFIFKCPPSWNCTISQGNVYVNAKHYGARMWLSKVIPENFQTSMIRHPQYKTPVVWLNDFRQKKQVAVNVFPETVKYKPGTDGRDTPIYDNVDLSKLQEIKAKTGTGVAFHSGYTDSYAIIPLTQTDVVLINPSLISDPILKEIISTITSK